MIKQLVLAGMAATLCSGAALANMPWEDEDRLNLDISTVQQAAPDWNDQCMSCTSPLLARTQRQFGNNGLNWGDETRVGMGFDVGGMTVGAYGDVNELNYTQSYTGGFSTASSTPSALNPVGVAGFGGNGGSLSSFNNAGTISATGSLSQTVGLSAANLGPSRIQTSFTPITNAAVSDRAASTRSGSEDAYTEYVGGLFMATSF